MFHRPARFTAPATWTADFVRHRRFGIVVSQLDGELQFSHLPLLIDIATGPDGQHTADGSGAAAPLPTTEPGAAVAGAAGTAGEPRIVALRGHFARANPHWRALAADPRATVIFHGPDAYMSAQWYSPGCPAAPSWNFVTVHVNGRVELLDTPQQTTAIVDELIAVNEAELPTQWSVADYSPERRAALTPHILGFRLHVTSVEPKFKLNQHYPDADKIGAIAGLRSRGTDDARAIADLMEATLGQGAQVYAPPRQG